MNWSLLNVIIGGFSNEGGAGGDRWKQFVREATPSDFAIELKYANKVIVVSGYELAVAQAQHVVYELENMLEEEGVNFIVRHSSGSVPYAGTHECSSGQGRC